MQNPTLVISSHHQYCSLDSALSPSLTQSLSFRPVCSILSFLRNTCATSFPQLRGYVKEEDEEKETISGNTRKARIPVTTSHLHPGKLFDFSCSIALTQPPVRYQVVVATPAVGNRHQPLKVRVLFSPSSRNGK